MEIRGIYPMLYAFFDTDGRLRREAFSRQIETVVASGAAGVAVLGLGTEVGKLGSAERSEVIDWVVADVAGRLPVAVTLGEGNLPDMVASARAACRAGATWLILQPPRPPVSSRDLIRFFAQVADAVDCPVAIQNAPEFLGVGLTGTELLTLQEASPNVVMVKAEASAVTIGRLVETLAGRMRVFNGRAGLELTDNYRAGVDGMIPGLETIDRQVAIERAMLAGDEDAAETLYQSVLPALSFIMQGLPHFLVYGKLLAALRLAIAPSSDRLPSDSASPQGVAWTRRFAASLGPLPS